MTEDFTKTAEALAESDIYRLMLKFQRYYSSNPALGGYTPINLELAKKQFPDLLTEEGLKRLVDQGYFTIEDAKTVTPKLLITDKGWKLRQTIAALKKEATS
jgi:hypothetical protein